MDKLDPAKILQYSGPDARRLILLDEVESTNSLAKRLAVEGAGHGTAVLAERQSAGRGRMGRTFLSPSGGLYLSVILRPETETESLMPLTALLAQTACEAVCRVCGVRPGIKWVNDLVLEGKKIAGILTEPVFTPEGQVDFVVCGIGVNCNTPTDRFSPEVRQIATSLAAVLGKPVCRNRLAAELLRGFSAPELMENVPEQMEKYRQDCITPGREVRVVRGTETFYARADRVEDDGSLWVTDSAGKQQKIFSGEVSVRGMYGYL